MTKISYSRAGKSRVFASILVFAVTWTGAACAQPATAPTVISTPIIVDGTLVSDASKPARDVSGIACARPRSGGQRTCLVVDDEAGFAQRVTLDGNTIRVGNSDVSLIQILTRLDDPDIHGQRPTGLACREDTDRFTQLDGEGVAFEETRANGSGVFYVTGSHGCSRSSGQGRPSQFILARIIYDAETDTFGEAARTWRLSEALRAATTLGQRFGHLLDNAGGDGGLDIEGIAVDRGRLLVGFRAPNIGGNAFILPVPLASLFVFGGAIVPEQLIELPLGRAEGIRDLASIPDGRLLVLTGPAPNEADVQARLMAFDPLVGAASLAELAKLPAPTPNSAKYEGVVVLEQAGGALSVVIVQDGPPNGNPARLRISLP
ncbi:DUF3616 domain-containing protein [Muricoccus vinaceus]|uniref:DUF3616 domain-containing protein n=1 Tax=Muricoccus vinaceus TaxID=424704 RepID=A0ABV6IX12_9PROT